MEIEDKNEIDKELCAEGLHRMLLKYTQIFSLKEKAVMYGAISLLYELFSDEWHVKSTKRYDNWNPFEILENEKSN